MRTRGQVVEPTVAAPATRGRVTYLDGIRGLGALLVVLQHVGDAWAPFNHFTRNVISPGRVGVIAFFTVSGYVATMTLTRQPLRTFTIRRFWRLYPLYWLTTVTFLAVAAAVGQYPHLSTLTYTVNATMMQGFANVDSILSVAWTLGTELVLYAQLMVLARLGLLRLAPLVAAVWLAAFAAVVAGNAVTGRHIGWLAPCLLVSAGIGAAMFLYSEYGSQAIGWALVAGVVGVPALGVFFKMDPAVGGWPAVVMFDLSYVAGIGVFLTAWAMRHKMLPGWIKWFARISFTLYLIHPVVLLACTAVIPARPLAAAATVSLSLLLAWGMHERLEVPLNRLGHRLSSRRPQ